MKHTSIVLNTAFMALAVLMASGCTHAMKITKGPAPPTAMQGPAQPVKVGFTSVEGDPLLQSAITAVKGHASIAECKDNYSPAGGFTPDYVCQLTRESKFKSSGQNFLITFPGYVLFTHAWLGYQYGADITTRSTLLDPSSNVISQVEIETPYQFRHCSFGRGAATSCLGWLTPGYGVATVIPAVVFAAKYDKSATPAFFEQASATYGGYVASKVLEQMAQAQAGCVKPPPSVAALSDRPSGGDEAIRPKANNLVGPTTP